MQAATLSPSFDAHSSRLIRRRSVLRRLDLVGLVGPGSSIHLPSRTLIRACRTTAPCTDRRMSRLSEVNIEEFPP